MYKSLIKRAVSVDYEFCTMRAVTVITLDPKDEIVPSRFFVKISVVLDEFWKTDYLFFVICNSHRLPRIRFAVKAKTTKIGIAGNGGNKIVSRIAMRLNSGRFSSSFAKYHMLPKSNQADFPHPDCF